MTRHEIKKSFPKKKKKAHFFFFVKIKSRLLISKIPAHGLAPPKAQSEAQKKTRSIFKLLGQFLLIESRGLLRFLLETASFI